MAVLSTTEERLHGLYIDLVADEANSKRATSHDSALDDEIAALKREVWELRDQRLGDEALQRSTEYLVEENQRLRHLLKRPWLTARLAAKPYGEKVRRRVVSARSVNS